MSAKENAAVWLREHVVSGENCICTCNALYENYSAYCQQEAVDSASSQTFKRLVSAVWPGSSSIYTSFKGKRVHVYKGIVYKKRNVCAQQGDLDRLITQLPHCWHIMERNERQLSVQYDTGMYVNGFGVFKTLMVSSTGSITISVGSTEIPPSYLGLSANIWNSRLSFTSILSILEDSPVCQGKSVRKETAGYERWTTKNSEATKIRKRAVQCCILLPAFGKMTMCAHCLKNVRSYVRTEPSITDFPDDTILDHLFPNATADMLDILQAQSKCCRSQIEGADVRSRRWPKSVLSLAVRLWISCPASYHIMKSKLYLPSESLLNRYKKKLDKDAEMNECTMTEMHMQHDHQEGHKEGEAE